MAKKNKEIDESKELDIKKGSSKTDKKSAKNSKKNKNNAKNAAGIVPKTVQESIPYTRVYENGIIETDKGVFSKSYYLGDVNFQIAAQEEQEEIFLSYSDLLNSFGAGVKIQISIKNQFD